MKNWFLKCSDLIAWWLKTPLTRSRQRYLPYDPNQRIWLIRGLLIVFTPLCLYYTVHEFRARHYIEAILIAMQSCILVTGGVYLFRYRKEEFPRHLGLWLVNSYFILEILLLFIFGVKGNLQFLGWFFLFPMLVFFVLGEKNGSWLVLLALLAISAALFFGRESLPDGFDFWELKFQIFTWLVAVAIITFFYEHARNRTQRMLVDQQEALKASEQRYRNANQKLARMLIHLQATEKALNEVNNELELRVKQRTADLAQANRKLQEEVAAKAKLTQGLIESERKYRTLFEDSVEAISVTRKGEIIDVNRAWLAMHGYTDKGEVVGRKIIDFICEEDRPILKNRQDQYPSLQDLIYQVRDLTRSGDLVEVEVFPSKIRFEGEEAVLTMLRDVTRLKESERERQRLEKKLMHSEKMQAIGQLAGGIAHNFNNLLMGIQGNAELILLDAGVTLSIHEKVDNILEHVHSGANLTRQLLGYAREGKYESRVIHPNDILRRTSRMFGATRKEITIHEDYQETLWAVEADPSQIEQVLFNLYLNAWHAMPDGGDLFLSTENVHIDQKEQDPRLLLPPGRYVKLAVSDNGVGMDEETQERIFEPFFTTKDVGKRAGLGLASVYGIIQNHGGLIEVDSQPGRGTAFHIYLPVAGKQAPSPAPSPSSFHLAQGRETILLVDDETAVLDISARLIRKLGYKVIQAESGQAAVELYAQKAAEIDLVILDMIMPGMSGRKTFDRLQEIDPRVRILLSSGYSQNSEATDIMQRGCSGFIQKPFDIRKLSHEIRRILNETLAPA